MINAELFVQDCVNRNGKLLISILEDIQEQYNYLPEIAMEETSKQLKIPLKDVYGVATFYNAFTFVPEGKYVLTICTGTACHVREGARIAEVLSQELKIKPGQTTPDMQFTLKTVNCLGCCALGPVVVLNGEYYGQMTTKKALTLVKQCRRDKIYASSKG